jgi:hypothetical protein
MLFVFRRCNFYSGYFVTRTLQYDVFVMFLFPNPLIYGVKLAAKMNRAESRHKKLLNEH